MNIWRSAVVLSRFQWKQDWPGMLFTFLFVIYSGGLVGGMMSEVMTTTNASDFVNALADFMYITLIPAFGMLLNRTSFHIYRHDSYNRRTGFMRTMPIPASSILLARWFQTGWMLPVNGLLFSMLQYVISAEVRDTATLAEWLGAGLVWIGYGVVLNGFFIWLELACTGKTFVIVYTLFFVATIGVAALIRACGIVLVKEVLEGIQTAPATVLGIMIAAVAIVVAAAFRLTLRRFRMRSFPL